MSLSNDRGKNSFVSLQFFLNCFLNIVPIALIPLKAVIERRKVL